MAVKAKPTDLQWAYECVKVLLFTRKYPFEQPADCFYHYYKQIIVRVVHQKESPN